jgi:hypothetical protein
MKRMITEQAKSAQVTDLGAMVRTARDFEPRPHRAGVKVYHVVDRAKKLRADRPLRCGGAPAGALTPIPFS